MADSRLSPFASLPAIERLLTHSDAASLINQFGRSVVTRAMRNAVAEVRAGWLAGSDDGHATEISIIQMASLQLQKEAVPSLRRVFNLTGTVVHTNLGRAPLPAEAIEAIILAAREPSNLELDLTDGRRGDRESHLEQQLCELTGAEAATIVNNNAAAVLLTLNTVANRKEVITSRGELVEIGGSFRIPDIMARSGCRLREVGTTNRTHLSDYESAIGPKTGLVMKVHTSNYTITGFTSVVPEADLARLSHERGIPFAVDLGSGTLIDLQPFGLPHEPTPSESIAKGVDLVTFSGDKLLGGPQAGIIVGRADLVKAMKRNPLKRALRVDKMTIAALSAVLRLYSNPESLAQRLPILRLLTRPLEDIRALADRLRPTMVRRLQGIARVDAISCESQPGSGSLPTQTIPSAGLSIRPFAKTSGETRRSRKSDGAALERIARAFRSLPVPVIGRIQQDAFLLDLRCLEDEQKFVEQLSDLRLDPVPTK